MTLQSKWKTICLTRLILTPMLLIAASASAAAQTNTFPSSGSAGIGTTSPERPIHVKDPGSYVGRFESTSTGSFFELIDTTANSSNRGILGNYLGDFFLQKEGSIYGIEFFTGTTSKMKILNNGNIGIGTTTPGVGGITSSTYLTLAGSGSNRPAFEFVSNLSDGVGKEAGFLEFVFNTNSAGHKRIGNISVDTEGSTANQRGGVMRFFTKPNGSATMLERMRLDSLGYLGIGTTTPGYPLDVTGSARINAGSVSSIIGTTAAYWNGFKSNAPTGVWGFQQSERAFMGVGGNLYYRGFSANALSLFNGNTTAEDIILYNKNSADAGFLVLKDSGRVGVGVVSPNYSLDVNGEINATGFRINGTPISGGGSSQWTTSGSNIYYNSGNVGIGATNPGTKLEVAGTFVSGKGQLLIKGVSDHGYLYVDTDTPATKEAGVNIAKGGATRWGMYVPANSNDLRFFDSADRLTLQAGGNVGIGTANPTKKLHVAGDIQVDGNINAKYQDLAEWVPSSEQLSAGTVVVLDQTKSNQVISSNAAYDTRVAGVISAQPGIALGESGDGKVLVATTGRVRVKVDASRGPIQIGDLLVTSDISGVAMKSEPVEFAGRKMHMPGTIIGKALEPLTKGTGEILVLLSLQ